MESGIDARQPGAAAAQRAVGAPARRRFEANTYLNELTRADYRRVLVRHFEILEERVAQPGLGRGRYGERARAALSAWSEDELFSNQTLFVLRPRHLGPAGRRLADNAS